MITRFGSLFAGNVDLDDIGFEGTPVNDRWLSDQHLTTAFDKCVSFTQLMDELGYDTFCPRSTISSGKATSAFPTC